MLHQIYSYMIHSGCSKQRGLHQDQITGCTQCTVSALQRKSHLCIPRNGIVRPISTFMCLWAIYILPVLVQIFSYSRIGRPIVEIYKSLTVTWMWKFGLRLCKSFSWNICFEFSVLCLCSVSRIVSKRGGPGEEESSPLGGTDRPKFWCQVSQKGGGSV